MNYKEAKIIAFDIETKDPNLLSLGTGVYRKDGYICGVAFACKYADGTIESEYVALQHPNNDKDDYNKGCHKISKILALDVPKVAANAMYDLDWLVNGYGFKANGKIHDVQYAEPILDEYRKSYSLNSLAEKYLGEQKFDDEMEKWCSQNGYKITKGNRVQSYIWRMPSFVVDKYAREDAELTIKILDKQLPILKEENLLDIYNMEIALIPLYLRMRLIGVRIDVEKREANRKEALAKKIKIKKELEEIAGKEVNYSSGKQIAELFDGMGVPYERSAPTAKMLERGMTIGNPMLDKTALANIEHPIAEKIVRYKKYEYLADRSLGKILTETEVDGRIHAQFNPLKGDQGTVSGRYSSTAPNLQNQSSRDEEAKGYTRGIFIPEEGMAWASIDWSQIEYRVLAHYASGPGAEDVRLSYNDNPDIDYHQYVMDLTGLDRKPAKNCNFGLVYGMGINKAMEYFGWSREYTQHIFDTYHGSITFLRHTMNAVGNSAKRRFKDKKSGYITTILGRKARLPDPNRTYVMLNRLIQGSAADIMKKSMLMAWEEGVFDVVVPHITVHDELDVSFPLTEEGVNSLWRLKEIMETCVELRVPMKADLDVGFNWAELESVKTKTDLLGWVVENKNERI